MDTAVNAVVTGDVDIADFQANVCTDLNQYFDG
jgi:hypothetical protein